MEGHAHIPACSFWNSSERAWSCFWASAMTVIVFYKGYDRYMRWNCRGRSERVVGAGRCRSVGGEQPKRRQNHWPVNTDCASSRLHTRVHFQGPFFCPAFTFQSVPLGDLYCVPFHVLSGFASYRTAIPLEPAAKRAHLFPCLSAPFSLLHPPDQSPQTPKKKPQTRSDIHHE